MATRIKGILIDSGRVLNGPVTGHWMIPPNFFKHINRKAFYSISKSRRHEAFREASKYISEQNHISNEDEEYKHFLQYYKILTQELSELKLSNEQVEGIAKDLVYNYDKYEFYEDVKDIIPKLSRQYKLAVVSDAWPSLTNVFIKAGMKDFFSAFIISSVIGTTKPDKLMYKSALDELGLLASEVIFVDDNIRHCQGAKEVGINQTYLLCRDLKLFMYYKLTCKHHKVVKDLRMIEKDLNTRTDRASVTQT